MDEEAALCAGVLYGGAGSGQQGGGQENDNAGVPAVVGSLCRLLRDTPVDVTDSGQHLHGRAITLLALLAANSSARCVQVGPSLSLLTPALFSLFSVSAFGLLLSPPLFFFSFFTLLPQNKSFQHRT